ncbi:MAG: hypothetical protein ABWZ25_00930 [Chitinophagaceae bacterium]
MEQDDKIFHRFKLATALRKILDRNKEQVEKNILNEVESFWIVDSIRQLEASSRLSYTIVQGVFAAKRDIQFSSLMSILGDGFGISFSEFAEIYDSVTDDEIKTVKKYIESSAKKKKPVRALKKKKK